MSHGALDRDLRALQALAAGLCLDARVTILPGQFDTCSFDPERREIALSESMLARVPPEACAGVIAHEAGHAHLSRYLLFDTPFPSAVALNHVRNAIEDPRVETWMAREFPGTARFIAAASRQWRREPPGTHLPAFLRFSLECTRDPDNGWSGPLSAEEGRVDPVLRALAITRAARRAYALTFPDPDVGPAESFARYVSEVIPRLDPATARPIPEHPERLVRLSALEAQRLAEAQVLPVAAELVGRDLRVLATAFRRDRGLRERARQSMRRDGERSRALVLEVMATAASWTDEESAGRVDDPTAELARRVLDAALREEDARTHLGRRPARRSRSGGPDGPRQADEAATNAQFDAGYERIRARVAAQVQELLDEIAELMPPPPRMRLVTGYRSGVRPDLRRVMQSEADSRRSETLWMRRQRFEDPIRDSAFCVLVDLSGSMRGEKTGAAEAGVVLLVETLEALGIPQAVYGFQDELIRLRDFGEAFDERVRQRIASIGKEISGCRRGGHNRPRWNDDGPALEDAARSLRAQEARRRVLVVISDGEPAGRHSSEGDLRRATRAIEAAGDIHLVGVGLGPETAHVTRYYTHAVANVPIPDLSRQLAKVLHNAVTSPSPSAFPEHQAPGRNTRSRH